MRYWRRENQEEARKVAIVAQKFITWNRWKGFGAIFNSTYKVFQLVENDVVIMVVQADVEEVNELISDGTWQSMQTNSLNVDHEYQEPIKALNMLLLNTPKIIINAFGTIDWVTKEGWLQIPRWKVDKKSMKTLNNGGNNDCSLEMKLFGTTIILDLFNTRTLSIRQPTTATTMMNVNPLMVVILANALRIQLLKYHDNGGLVIWIR